MTNTLFGDTYVIGMVQIKMFIVRTSCICTMYAVLSQEKSLESAMSLF